MIRNSIYINKNEEGRWKLSVMVINQSKIGSKEVQPTPSPRDSRVGSAELKLKGVGLV